MPVWPHSFTPDDMLSCPKAVSPLYATMRSVTLLHPYYISEVCSNISIELQLLPLIREDLSIRSANSGSNACLIIAAAGAVALKRPSLMSEFLIPSQKVTWRPLYLKPTATMKMRRRENMNVSLKLNMHPSPHPCLLISRGGMSNITSHFLKYIAESIAVKRKSS